MCRQDRACQLRSFDGSTYPGVHHKGLKVRRENRKAEGKEESARREGNTDLQNGDIGIAGFTSVNHGIIDIRPTRN